MRFSGFVVLFVDIAGQRGILPQFRVTLIALFISGSLCYAAVNNQFVAVTGSAIAIMELGSTIAHHR
jgi:hypothetical protein